MQKELTGVPTHYNREIRLLPEGTAQVADWDLEAFRVQALGLIEDRRHELMAARDRERHEREEAARWKGVLMTSLMTCR
ncbi:hypothetical protein [Streptomyces aureocirculatus]|uniref:hypothetical protein n=1 Tax=Streptomyces aureocirculatus TaxID=67275 RepID=UPI0004C7E9CD|nr:hypothetical protein [Streptomyces aureocirculatus]